MPRVSVVMPARNAATTLPATLDSLAAQTFRDFELVLVNDGSSDATPRLAEACARSFPVRVINHVENQGVARSINAGIQASGADLIARLDADDLARADRLAVQVAFMDAHADVDVCGSHIEMFSDDDVARSVLAHPVGNAAIKTAFVQRCAIAHPSAMVRRSFYDSVGLYDDRFDFAEDYELWTRGALLGKQFANIPDTLTHYRRHANQVSRQKAELQNARDMAIKNRYLAAWLDGFPPAYLAQFLSLTTQFPTRELAHAVLVQSTAAMLQLGRRVPDPVEYANVVAISIHRHLGGA